VVDAVVEWVMAEAKVEGTVADDILCPRLSRESSFQLCLELSGITPSTGVDGIDVLVVGAISEGSCRIHVKTHIE